MTWRDIARGELAVWSAWGWRMVGAGAARASDGLEWLNERAVKIMWLASDRALAATRRARALLTRVPR